MVVGWSTPKSQFSLRPHRSGECHRDHPHVKCRGYGVQSDYDGRSVERSYFPSPVVTEGRVCPRLTPFSLSFEAVVSCQHIRFFPAYWPRRRSLDHPRVRLMNCRAMRTDDLLRPAVTRFGRSTQRHNKLGRGRTSFCNSPTLNMDCSLATGL